MAQSTQAIIRIRADETVSRTAQVIRREMDKTGKSAKRAGQNVDKMDRGILSARQSAALLAAGLNGAIGLLSTAASAAVAMRDSIRNAAQSMAVEAQFGRVAKDLGGAAEALDRLTRASAGGIDATSLQKFAVQASAAGVELSQLEQLLQAANQAAQATGQSQTELTEQFVQGIVDLSDGSFKALGLQVDFGMAVGKTAADLGVASDALSVNRKRQIALQSVLSKTAEAYGDLDLNANLVAVNKLDAEWANLVDTIERGAAGAAVEVAKLLRIIEGPSRSENLFVGSTWRDVAGGIGAAALALADLAPFVDSTEAAVAGLGGEFANLESVLIGTQRAIKDEAIEARRAAEAKAAQESATREATEAQRSQREMLRETVAELARANKAQADQALALAQTAAEMGEAEIAARQFKRAQDMLTSSGASFARQERAKQAELKATALAFREQLKEMRLVERYAALFAPTQAERDQAFVEYQNILDRIARIDQKFYDERVKLIEEPSSDEDGDQGTGGSGSGARRPGSGVSRGGQSFGAAMFDNAVSAFQKRQAESAQAAAEAQAALRKAAVDANYAALADAERVLKMQDAAQLALASGMDSAARSALGMSRSFASGFGGAAAAVSNASGIIVDQVTQISAVMGQFKQAGLDSSEALVGAVPGMLSASGQLAAGFIQDQQAQAAVMGAFELAAAIGSFARLDYFGGAMHLVSSGLYFGVAGGAGGSGGAAAGAVGGGGARPPVLPERLTPDGLNPGRRPDTGDQGGNVNIYMSGATIIGSDDDRAGRDLAKIIAKATRRRSRPGSDFQPA